MSYSEDRNKEDERLLIEKEKRCAARRPTCSFFTVTIDKGTLEGAGANISQTGAYFVTCDEIPVEVVIRAADKTHKVAARITRIDKISEGSQGVAIQFDQRLLGF